MLLNYARSWDEHPYHTDLLKTHSSTYRRLHDSTAEGLERLIRTLRSALQQEECSTHKGVTISVKRAVRFLRQRWRQYPITDGLTFIPAHAAPGELTTVITYVRVFSRWRLIVVRGCTLPCKGDGRFGFALNNDFVALSPRWQRMDSVACVYDLTWKHRVYDRLQALGLKVHPYWLSNQHLIYVGAQSFQAFARQAELQHNLEDIYDVFVWYLIFAEKRARALYKLYFFPFHPLDPSGGGASYGTTWCYRGKSAPQKVLSTLVLRLESLVRDAPIDKLREVQRHYFQSPRSFLCLRRLQDV